jgi:thiol:disulfide interchange protein/DsbC/DsbD-like thiol-disulfide interchange protein
MRSLLKLNLLRARRFFALALVLAPFTLASAKIEINPEVGAPKRVEAVEVQLISNYAGIPPKGETLQLGLRIKHDPHWHTYWRNPGDSGLPTQFEVTLPAGWKASSISWPAPQAIAIGPLLNFGFEGEIVLPVKIGLPGDVAGNRAMDKDLLIQAKAQWLMCKDVCIPGEADLTLMLKAGAEGLLQTPFAPLFDAMQSKTPAVLLSARYHVDSENRAMKLRVDLPTRNNGLYKSAYFFPYETGFIKAPDPQLGFQLVDGLRLELALAPNAGIPADVMGLLTIDGMPFEVKATKALSNEPVVWLQGGTPLQVPVKAAQAPAVDVASQSLGFILGLAFLGGLILNLMPCVFPVLGLKVLGFASHGSARQADRVVVAGIFSAGVLVSFWLLAALMTALQGAGEAIGWGFQLQSPWFVIAMAWLFALIGLNLSGLFEIGLSLTRLGRAAKPLPSRWSEFGSGVLAVLVATPCTAPFMGAALGATLTQSVPEKFAVFTAIGMGMALPYVLLTLTPKLSNYLPKPGQWMETFKQLLAFPMYATVAWLAWVLGQQIDLNAVLMLLLSLTTLSMAAWFYGRWQRASGGSSLPLGLCSLAVSLALVYGVALENNREESYVQWEPWSEIRVQTSLSAGKPVLVDFTAAWCVSCQVNKKAVLDRDVMQQFFREKKIVLLRADWTKRDAAITKELARYGRNGVPLYQAWLPGATRPVLLPELLTSGAVTDAFSGTRKP